MGMDQERTKPMSDTPIFDQVSENIRKVSENAYAHGYLKARLDLLEYIEAELKTRRLSPSKGLKNIIDKLARGE
jgi:hypothetical protein